MVKKLAVVAAAVAATLLAVSPFALATDKPHHEKGDDAPVIGDVNSPNNQVGLVNLDDVNVLNGTNVCPDVGANVGGLLGGVLGSSHKSAIDCDSLSGND